jgi:hypothetical protein
MSWARLRFFPDGTMCPQGEASAEPEDNQFLLFGQPGSR